MQNIIFLQFFVQACYSLFSQQNPTTFEYHLSKTNHGKLILIASFAFQKYFKFYKMIINAPFQKWTRFYYEAYFCQRPQFQLIFQKIKQSSKIQVQTLITGILLFKKHCSNYKHCRNYKKVLSIKEFFSIKMIPSKNQANICTIEPKKIRQSSKIKVKIQKGPNNQRVFFDQSDTKSKLSQYLCYRAQKNQLIFQNQG
eukprot:TRINITY_DN7999_c0_g1_i2.p1 TRINITY_DN7999_c0_g1~~TRINITY_DN7999_c0_g1_i2.p1  ORF type:complete len:198 (-),score=-14.99 TRINITY_DN7999_c0_g1_i2:275-868(-)